MSFNTNSAPLDVQADEPMICPSTPRLPFWSHNWDPRSPPSSPTESVKARAHGLVHLSSPLSPTGSVKTRARRWAETTVERNGGLGVSAVPSPEYSDYFRHKRGRITTPTSTTTNNNQSGSGTSDGVAATVDAERKENRSSPKKTKQVQGGERKRDESAV